MASRTKGGKGGKCPSCSQRFPHTEAGQKAFNRHYAKAHPNPKKKIDKNRPWKKPGWAKRRK